MAAVKDGDCRLIAIELDEDGPAPARGFLEAERMTAIRDLVAERNSFRPTGCRDRRLRLRIAVRDNRLILDIADADAVPLVRHILSLAPARPRGSGITVRSAPAMTSLPAPPAPRARWRRSTSVGAASTTRAPKPWRGATSRARVEMDFREPPRRLFTPPLRAGAGGTWVFRD